MRRHKVVTSTTKSWRLRVYIVNSFNVYTKCICRSFFDWTCYITISTGSWCSRRIRTSESIINIRKITKSTRINQYSGLCNGIYSSFSFDLRKPGTDISSCVESCEKWAISIAIPSRTIRSLKYIGWPISLIRWVEADTSDILFCYCDSSGIPRSTQIATQRWE